MTSDPQRKPNKPLPWFYGAADILLALYVVLSFVGAVLLVTAKESSQTTWVIATVSLFFGLLFACLAQVLLDAGKHLRKIADSFPGQEKT